MNINHNDITETELKKISICDKFKSKSKLIPGIKIVAETITFELLMLFHFFRFISKGYCLNTSSSEYCWFIRKNEMLIKKMLEAKIKK